MATSDGALRALLEHPSVEVAPLLLGAILRHDTDSGSVALRITEVEAYLGDGADPGSHAYRGRTPRNAVMYDEPGHVYVYFTYGMHYCANIVCSPVGSASAVLLRAAEVVEGAELARARRGERVTDRDLARGPARLTVAAGIRGADNGSDALVHPFSLTLADAPLAFETGPRVGVSGPGGTAEYPWRFWLPDAPSVSPYRAAVPRSRRPGPRLPVI